MHQLSASWTDDAGVTEGRLLYWYDGGTTTNVSMTLGQGRYTYNLALPTEASGKLHYQFTARDAAGNWAITQEKTLSIVKNDGGGGGGGGGGGDGASKSSLLLWGGLIAVIVIVLIGVMLMLSRRRGQVVEAPPPVTETPPPPLQTGREGAQTGATVGAAAAAAVTVPIADAAPATTVARGVAKGPTGTFKAINVKTPCEACGGMMERGVNAYVCSCGTAIHEKCAGKLRMCPSCKQAIQLD
jgi:hypothetical protein